ncbi:MAG TPA: hypothetical protein VML92_06025 [Steroidobacteraceae bacterium]|nr:hypothetical protein [Steroidobacteraceae bacterium]
MSFEVIHNATHPVGKAKTFSEAQALMHDKAMEKEVELCRLHPGANIKAGWNRDSFYLDAMRGDTSLQREFWRIEERCS